MWNLRNPFKKRGPPPVREKNLVRAEVGRLGGIASGESRRTKKLDREVEKDILNKIPELHILRKIGLYYDIELSNQDLISLIPYLEPLKNLMNNHEGKTDY